MKINSVGRGVALVGVIVGLFLLISPFALDYPAKTQGVDNLTDSFRSTMTDEGLAQVRADMDTINAFAAQFQNEAAPAIAGALTQAGVLGSPEEFGPFVGANFPAVAAGLSQFADPILPHFNAIVGGLEANQHDFERADSIPTGWLPTTSVHWIILLFGLVVSGVAIFGLTQAGGGNVGAALGVIGVVLIALTLILQVPGKANSVDNLTDDFRDVFSTQGAEITRERFEIVRATSDELQAAMVPALAGALGMTPEELGGFLGEQFPDVANGLGQLDDIIERFDGLVTGIENNVSSFALADSVPTEGKSTAWFPWHLLAPGIILGLAGGASAVITRKQAVITRKQGEAR